MARPRRTEPAEAASKLQIYSSSSGLEETSDCPGTASSASRQCVTNKTASEKMILVKI